jgi:hypothetical protein
MWWSPLIHLGDLPLTMGAAAAITIWLLSARAWRLALCWALIFAAAIGLVAASKIAFLAHGAGIPALHFRALSGHASGVTAIAIALIFLALRGDARTVRLAATAGGMGIGALMVAMLVVHQDHSVAEAVAGWLIGTAAGAAFVWTAKLAPPVKAPSRLMFSAAAFVATMLVLRRLPIGYLMVKVARVLAHHASAFAVTGS